MQVKISDYLWFQEGPGVRNTQYTENGVKLLNVANLVGGKVDISNTSRYISEEEAYGKYKHFLVDEGDFIIASSGIKVEYFDKKMGFVSADQLPLCMNTSTIRFKVMDQSKVNIRYFMYYLKSDEFKEQLARQITGSAQLNFGPSHLKKMTMPIIDLVEQEDLVSKLDFVASLITTRREQLTKLDELVKSRFVELFGDPETNPKGWDRQRFDQICENLDSRRVPITSTDRKAGNYPYYGASGIVDYVEDYIFDEDILLISEDGANLLMRSTPIAFSVSGKVWVNNHAHVVRFESKATQKYIEVCFALTDISGSITGTAQPKLNQAKLNAMLFCIPPIELQEQFAAFVEQTDKSKLAIQESLTKLETLKKALMQQFFG